MNLWDSAAFRLGVSVFIAALIGYRGLRKKSLSVDGAVGALVVGTITLFAGLRFALTLLTFFYSSSFFTKYRDDVKRKIDAEHKEGGQRDIVQVLCNGLWGTLAAAAYIYLVGTSSQLPLDFRLHPEATIVLGFFIGHYATCAGDTWASELGVLAKHDPLLVLSLRRVPRGTNGAVSLLGCVVSVLGGCAVALAFYFGSLPGASLHYAFLLATLGAACGTVGSLVDSILGATLQYSGFCLTCKKVINDRSLHPATHSVSQISGINVLSNNAVNMLSALAGAVFGAWLSTRLF